MANNDPVILSEEPSSVRINIQDPNKPASANTGGKLIKKAQKVPWYERVISALFGADVNSQNLGEHIINDWAVPTGKRMINNGIQSGLKHVGDASQVMLFGRVVNSSSGPTDYTSFSNPNGVNPKPAGYRVMDQVDVFAFTDKRKAEECLAYLRGRIQTYGSASVVDYYEWINTNLQVDIPLDYNMTYRGWVDLNNVIITPDPNGFIINLPRPVGLKRG